MLDFLSQWWDVLTFILFSTILILVDVQIWRTKKSDPSLHDFPQKQIVAMFLPGVSNTTINVTGILISASLVYIELQQSSSTQVHHEALDHAFRMMIWFLASLLMGLFSIWMYGIYGQFENVIVNLYITIPFSLQFLALAIGAGHVLIGIYFLIYK
jgi:hypothetical protein